MLFFFFFFFFDEITSMLFSFFDIFLPLISVCLELFLFTKTEFNLSFFSVYFLNETPNFGTSRKSHIAEKQPESSQDGY